MGLYQGVMLHQFIFWIVILSGAKNLQFKDSSPAIALFGMTTGCAWRTLSD